MVGHPSHISLHFLCELLLNCFWRELKTVYFCRAYLHDQVCSWWSSALWTLKHQIFELTAGTELPAAQQQKFASERNSTKQHHSVNTTKTNKWCLWNTPHSHFLNALCSSFMLSAASRRISGSVHTPRATVLFLWGKITNKNNAVARGVRTCTLCRAS